VTSDPQATWWLYIDDAAYWEEAASYCSSTDTLPMQCDFLHYNRKMLSGGAVLVLLFSAIVALIPTIADLDQASDEREVMEARGVYKKGGSIPMMTRVLLYISHKARVR
jgi:hypothetical protein